MKDLRILTRMHRFILIEIAMGYLTFSEKISVLIADITFKLEK